MGSGGWTEELRGRAGGAGQESWAAVGGPVGLWYGFAGSSPITDGDRRPLCQSFDEVWM